MFFVPVGHVLNTLTPNDLIAVLPKYIYDPLSSFMIDLLGFLQVFTMAEPLTLTFGVELEFVLRFDLKDYPMDNPYDSLYKQDIDDIFDELNEIYPPLDQEDEDIAMVSKAQEESARDNFFHALAGKGFPISRGSKSKSDTWKITKDSSIKADDPLTGQQDVRYGYAGIELKSPALPYTAESLVKIREMCQHLEKFDIQVNKSCGLHVHVGNERKGFPLETMKNLCILTATFERELESIHPAHRISNFYARSIGSVFHNGNSLPGIRRMIRNAETVEDLIQLVQKGVKHRAYNLNNLKSSEDLRTFEFRQHEATINADAITRWVELTCGLVDKAHRFAVQDHLNAGEMDAYINHMNSIPQLSIIDLVKSLGLEDVASYYEGRGLHTHPSPPRSRAGSNNERAMTPSVRPENAMTPWVRPGNTVFQNGQQTVRTFMTSIDSRQRYEQAIGGYDAEIMTHDPRGVGPGVAGSEESAHNSRDSIDTASAEGQFFSLSMPVERTTSSTLPVMTRSIPTTAEILWLGFKDLFGRPVTAPDMANHTALSSPISKMRPLVSFNHNPATLVARSWGVSALSLRLIYALGYISKLGSLSRAIKPKWSALAIAPKSGKTWTASTSDW